MDMVMDMVMVPRHVWTMVPHCTVLYLYEHVYEYVCTTGSTQYSRTRLYSRVWFEYFKDKTRGGVHVGLYRTLLYWTRIVQL